MSTLSNYCFSNYIHTITLTWAVLSLALSITCFSSCSKDISAKEQDDLTLRAYFTQQNLSPIQTSSGLYYLLHAIDTDTTSMTIDSIISTQIYPISSDTIVMLYHGYFLDGVTFDRVDEVTTPAIRPIRSLLPGLEEGLKLLSKDTTGTFYVPSSLAFGQEGSTNGMVPPNTPVIFEVTLLDFY
jgi:FKBP-type peptidyl-prolyl cis-trans isomerase